MKAVFDRQLDLFLFEHGLTQDIQKPHTILAMKKLNGRCCDAKSYPAVGYNNRNDSEQTKPAHIPRLEPATFRASFRASFRAIFRVIPRHSAPFRVIPRFRVFRVWSQIPQGAEYKRA